MVGIVKANLIDDFLELLGFGDSPENSSIHEIVSSNVERTCKEGTCTLILHSTPKYVYEDETWKKVEEARSLKDKGFEVKFSNSDKNFPLEVLDFNYTHATVKINTKTKYINTFIPIVVTEKKINVREIGDESSSNIEENTVFNSTVRFLSTKDLTMEVPFGLGRTLKYGFDSTEITLSIADTENMDDTYLDEYAPTTDNGASVNLDFQGLAGRQKFGMYKWNLTSIPAGQIITNAQLSVSISSNTYDVTTEGCYLRSYRVFQNFSWDESLIWNNRPTVGYYDPVNASDFKVFGGTGEPTGRQNITVTSVVNNGYQDGDMNVSIYLPCESGFGSPTNTDMLYTYSKEQTGTANDPILYITYETAPSTPQILNPLLNESSIIQNNPVKFNATITDEDGNETISKVMAQYQVPSSITQCNYTNYTTYVTTIKANDINVQSFSGSCDSQTVPCGTELTSADYLKVGSSNNVRAQSPLIIDYDWEYFIFNFSIPEYTTLNWVFMSWEGYAAGDGEVWFYIYNFTSASWTTKFDQQYCTSDCTRTYNITNPTDLSRYVSNNRFIFSRGYSYQAVIYTDYAYITVSYNVGDGSIINGTCNRTLTNDMETIQLQSPDTENMEDAYVRQLYATTNYGGDTHLDVADYSSYSKRTYIMFNISSLPAGNYISEAKLCLNLYEDGTTDSVSSYHVLDHGWDGLNEGTITWNNQPCGTGFTDSGDCNLTASDTVTSTGAGWKCWDVTNAVTREYNEGDINVSIALKTPESSTKTEDDYYSKEYETASSRPYLNISYYSTNYEYDWTLTSQVGRYNITDIYANDTTELMNHTTYTDLYFDVTSITVDATFSVAMPSDYTSWTSVTGTTEESATTLDWISFNFSDFPQNYRQPYQLGDSSKNQNGIARPIFFIDATGNVNMNISLKFSSLPTGITIGGNSSCTGTYTSCQSSLQDIDTSYVTLVNDLSQTDSFGNITLYANVSSTASDGETAGYTLYLKGED